MTTFTARHVVVAGPSTSVRRLISALGPHAAARIPAAELPPPAFDDLHAVVAHSMRSFAYRAAREAPNASPGSRVSEGSLLHDYFETRKSLIRSGIRPRRDAAFAERYLEALRAISLRRAAGAYAMIVHVGPRPEADLCSLIDAAGIPRISVDDNDDEAQDAVARIAAHLAHRDE